MKIRASIYDSMGHVTDIFFKRLEIGNLEDEIKTLYPLKGVYVELDVLYMFQALTEDRDVLSRYMYCRHYNDAVYMAERWVSTLPSNIRLLQESPSVSI
jgi:hypothetical protein